MRIGFIGDSLTQGEPGCAYVARLRRALPEHRLVNLGVGGDTVSSLLHRIRRLPRRARFDLAFLWVGVNDFVPEKRGRVRVTGTLMPQRPAVDMGTFRVDYAAALDVLRALSTRVVAVSPLFKGEWADDPLNQGLKVMTEIIREVATERGDVTFLDLRTEMIARLIESPGPDYGPGKPFRVLWDVLTARSDAVIDRRATRRGYRYSLDGLHLNTRGADYVTERFRNAIKREIRRQP